MADFTFNWCLRFGKYVPKYNWATFVRKFVAYYFQKSSKLVTLFVTISYGKKAFCSMDPGQSSFLTIPGGIEEEEEAK